MGTWPNHGGTRQRRVCLCVILEHTSKSVIRTWPLTSVSALDVEHDFDDHFPHQRKRAACRRRY
jgi:hypothetical protein